MKKNIYTYTNRCASVLEDVAKHREFQDLKWGRKSWNDSNEKKLSVLSEEQGEVARALNDEQGIDHLYEEIIQVAACAVAWAEELKKDVNHPNLIESSLEELKKIKQMYKNISKHSLDENLNLHEQKEQASRILSIFKDLFCKKLSLAKSKEKTLVFDNSIVLLINNIKHKFIKTLLQELAYYKNPLEDNDIIFNIELYTNIKYQINSLEK